MTSLVRPPFPVAIDNSMRVEFRRCPRKFYWKFLRHLHQSDGSVHLVAGKAYAQGLEVYRRAIYVDGLDVRDAFALGVSALFRSYGDFDPGDNVKTAWNMVGALDFYVKTWLPETDFLRPVLIGDTHAIEFSFQLPLDIAHPETGEPILFTGRNDMIANRGSALFIEDDKTTTQLRKAWAKSWKLFSQFLGYEYAAHRLGYPTVGTIVRRIAIHKYDYASAEAILYHTQADLARWETQFYRDVKAMIACWQEGYWDYDLGDACNDFGACPYIELCSSPNPETWTKNYVVREWNPIHGD